MNHLKEYWGELEALSHDTSNWPAGDNRSKASELIRKARSELIRAEAASDGGRSVEKYVDEVNRLVQLIMEL